jgi:hypothetical protein
MGDLRLISVAWLSEAVMDFTRVYEKRRESLKEWVALLLRVAKGLNVPTG